MTKENFWEEIYEKNIGRLIVVCYRYVFDRQEAEDLAHSAFLKAIEKSDTLKASDKVEVWLTKITINETLQYLKRLPQTEKLPQDLSEEEDPPNDSVIYQADFSQEELLSAIQELPITQRVVFNLYAIDQYSHTQIAEKLQITTANSKTILSRARKQLQQILIQKAKQLLK